MPENILLETTDKNYGPFKIVMYGNNAILISQNDILIDKEVAKQIVTTLRDHFDI